MFNDVSQLWIVIILLAGVVIATGRWIVAKTTGKEVTPGDLDILNNLRTKIVNAIASNTYLVTLEKEKGRQAVLEEIGHQINEYINSVSTLSPLEKDLLISLDKTTLINYVEQELIKLNILKPE